MHRVQYTIVDNKVVEESRIKNKGFGQKEHKRFNPSQNSTLILIEQ